MDAEEFAEQIELRTPPFGTPKVKVLVDGELYDVKYVEYESSIEGDRIVIVVQ